MSNEKDKIIHLIVGLINIMICRIMSQKQISKTLYMLILQVSH